MSAVPFSTAQIEQLQTRPEESRIHTRSKNRLELRYLEGHDVIDMANTVFGYHGWSYKVTRLEQTGDVWFAVVLLSVATPEGETVQREDVGVGVPAVGRDQAGPSGDAQETAIKGAVTDALKRALRTFGYAFGNSLYDKSDGATSAKEESSPNLTGRQQPDDDARTCPSCEQPMVLRSGTTRDGRPYSAWFCSAKCGQRPLWLTERKAS